MNYNNQIGTFQQDKQKWENAIINYNGGDPLDLWYNFICWYEQNAQFDHECLFETALSKCLSTYECQQHYNQDTRMVRLWMKYIDLKPNPLNLYQVLYTRGIGTQCAIFYIGWAHYYDSANAFKQAESVYNLGFQAKAQPFRELEEAHKNFRLSISQRMLYDDQQSKKRTASHLSDLRQQITTLKPPPTFVGANNNCQPSANHNNHNNHNANHNIHNNHNNHVNGDGGGGGEPYPPTKKFRPYREDEWMRSGRRVDEDWTKTARRMDEMPDGSQTGARWEPDTNQAIASSNRIHNNNNSAACAIASSLNSVYGDGQDGNAYEYNGNASDYNDSNASHYVTAISESIVISDTEDCGIEGSINIPPNFCRSAKNHHETWVGALFLDEPDVNKICKYPRHLVYPGNGSEYSLEEIRARNYTTIIEAIKETNRQREHKLAEQQRVEQMHREEQARLKNEREKMERMQRAAAAAAQCQMESSMLSQCQPNQGPPQYHHNANNHHNSSMIMAPHSVPSTAGAYGPQYNHYHHLAPPPPQQLHPQRPPMPPQMHMQPQQQSQPQIQRQSLPQPLPYRQHQQSMPILQPQQPIPFRFRVETERNEIAPRPERNHHHQPQQQQQQQQPIPPAPPTVQPYQQQLSAPPIQNVPNNSLVNNNVNHFEDDIEEQIEASTILLDNGQSKPQKITIKFRKERTGVTATTSFSNTVPSPTASPSATKTPKQKKKKKKKRNAGKTAKEPTDMNVDEDADADEDDFPMVPPMLTSSNDSYSSATSPKTIAKLKTKSTTRSAKFEYVRDEAPIRTWAAEFDDSDDENNSTNGTATGGSAQFNFTGVSSTPIRNNNNVAASAPVTPAQMSSKSSTPRNTFRMLRRRTSNASLPNHTFTENDDSMTSFSMVEPNSFFETENDDELRQQRLDKALKTIEQHFQKSHIDPFNSELCKAFLTKCGFPSREQTNFYKLSSTLLSKLSNTKTTTIGEHRFNIEKEVGRGAYGSVYRATNANTGDIVALKYQKPPNTWELYICNEVTQKINDRNMLLGFMDISSAIIAPNASIFVTEFSQFGSLLDINNRIRQATTKVMHESLVMHFTSQILNIVHHLHSCKIIHGDIKPDNFLLMKIPNTNSHVPTLRLIDFGCAIDMNFFEPDTQFRKIIQTDGFTCPEMLEGRPWSYQTDIFCIAGTVHVMLFGEYMQVVKKFGQYEIKQKLPRYLKKHIWTEFFAKFLNIKDLHHLPDLLDIKEKIDDEVYNMESELQSQIRTLSNILHKR